MTTPALSLDAAALANFVNAVNDPPGLRIWDDAPEHSLVTRGLAMQHSGEPAIVSRAASVQIFSDRIVVASPGYPPAPLTLAKLRKGNYRPCSRNPLIAQALATDPVTSPFSLRGRPFQLSAFRISAFPPVNYPKRLIEVDLPIKRISALFPSSTDEKRWVDGVLARKKGLGF